jgi:glycosyltransferase involved in cell wall biosynthesis
MVPKVSLGMPVYNGEKHIEAALESILAQTFEDFELIICDNCSDDGTEEICRAFVARESRIRYRRNVRNVGAAANYNLTFELSCGKYFKWFAHDDVCAPAHLDKCVEALEGGTEDVVLCYPKTTLIDEYGRTIGDYDEDPVLPQQTPDWRLAYLLGNLKQCNAAHGLMRSDALRRTRLIGSYFASDVVFLAELALIGKFKRIDEHLFYRRIHPGASRRANRTYSAVSAWFNPSKRNGVVLPLSNLLLELVRSITRSELSRAAKAACLVTVFEEWVGRYWRQIGGEAKIGLRALSRAFSARREEPRRLASAASKALSTISYE